MPVPLWLQAGTYPASADRRLLGALWPAAACTGLAVTAVGGQMRVSVAPGQAAVPTQNNSGSTLCTNDAATQVGPLATAPASGTNRIDLIIVRPRGTDLDGGANNDYIFDFVTGNPAATPVAPALPAGTMALAQVYIAGGSAAIVAGNITDMRPGPLNVGASQPNKTPQGWMVGAVGPSVQTDAPATATTIVQISFPVVAGRKYRVTVTTTGNQITSAASPRSYVVILSGPVTLDNPQNYILFVTSAAASTTLFGQAALIYTATANGTATLAFQGSTTAGAYRFAPNLSQMIVEDAGST